MSITTWWYRTNLQSRFSIPPLRLLFQLVKDCGQNKPTCLYNTFWKSSGLEPAFFRSFTSKRVANAMYGRADESIAELLVYATLALNLVKKEVIPKTDLIKLAFNLENFSVSFELKSSYTFPVPSLILEFYFMHSPMEVWKPSNLVIKSHLNRIIITSLTCRRGHWFIFPLVLHLLRAKMWPFQTYQYIRRCASQH